MRTEPCSPIMTLARSHASCNPDHHHHAAHTLLVRFTTANPLPAMRSERHDLKAVMTRIGLQPTTNQACTPTYMPHASFLPVTNRRDLAALRSILAAAARASTSHTIWA